MRNLLISIFAFMVLSISAQITITENYPFKNGEIASFEAAYEYGLIEFTGGTFSFITEQKKEDDQQIFLFKTIGSSLPSYDWIFEVRDTLFSKVNYSNFHPIYFQRNTSEGDYKVFNEIFFDDEKKSIFIELRNSVIEYRKNTIKWKAEVFDLQTAVYHVRMLEFKNAKIGDKYEFHILMEGSISKITITYEGKEFVELEDDLSFNCYKISTQVGQGTLVKSDETVFIWLSDDSRHIPVKLEAPLQIGKVKAELVKYKQGK
mgnify:CR=1 FL=1